jgi:hypothetical protein
MTKESTASASLGGFQVKGPESGFDVQGTNRQPGRELHLALGAVLWLALLAVLFT